MSFKKDLNEEELHKIMLEHHIATVIPKKVWSKYGMPIIAKGEGLYMIDINGRRYLDCVSQSSLTVGYANEEIARVMYEQARQLQFVSFFMGVAPVTLELEAKLAQITPGTLSAVLLTNNGSDAVEAALQLAKQYHISTGNKQKYKVISRRHAFHGITAGALTCTGPEYSALQRTIEPLAPWVFYIDAPYCYRCPFNLQYPSCDVECAKQLEEEIQLQDPDLVAAFIGEPVMVNAGIRPPVPEYWPMIRSICDKYGVLLILDENMTGFGKSGKWWSIDHWSVEPDILVLGKSMGASYIPIGATIMKSELYEKMPYFLYAQSFIGHAVAASASLTNINIIEREHLVENAREVGSYMLDKLKTLYRHSIVGDVWGMGLVGGIELVRDKQTKEMFPARARVADKVFIHAEEHGIFLRDTSGGNVVFFLPPIAFTRKEIDIMVDAVDKSLTDVERDLSKGG